MLITVIKEFQLRNQEKLFLKNIHWVRNFLCEDEKKSLEIVSRFVFAHSQSRVCNDWLSLTKQQPLVVNDIAYDLRISNTEEYNIHSNDEQQHGSILSSLRHLFRMFSHDDEHLILKVAKIKLRRFPPANNNIFFDG